MDEDDEFYDTISLNSQAPIHRKRINNKEYISLSRNTIYHSAIELDNMDNHDATSSNWRSFSMEDLPDYVIAYDTTTDPIKLKKRETFEQNLIDVGLILKKDEHQHRINFIKIYVPREVLCQYAELLKLRLPIKDPEGFTPKENIFSSVIKRCLDRCKVRLDEKKFPPQQYKLTAEFSRDKYYLFDVDDPNFFNIGVRISVISYILDREKYGKEDHSKGIKNLISTDVYKAAYPLHDGDLNNKSSKRKLLLDEWASVSKWVKYQPIDDIKDYFGVKFALYFTWLGFYTHMLIPASIVGILCLLYGIISIQNDTLSGDICNKDIVMCPLCDRVCNFWQLKDSCVYSKIVRLIDNPATIFFAVFMSVWAAVYLELWKRYSAEIAHRWGLTGFDLLAEPPRPEYLTRLANAKKKKLNVVTSLEEPVVPFWRVKLPSIILSFSIVLLWVILALGVVAGIVLYRMSLLSSSALYSDKTSYRIYVVPLTAGLINLVCIVILNFLYDRLAQWLTEMELQRTQTEFDDSLSLKIYMFQFVNYYSCIFYIAFIKGKFVGYPAKYNRIFGHRQEECNPGGCLMELTMQLAIIMIGNQFISGIIEMLLPVLLKIYNTISSGFKSNEKTHCNNVNEINEVDCKQYKEDYKLNSMDSRTLFTEYLEMVLQYGFVTIFVTAFPLAPLFALINNIFEMRLDAKKFIKYYRRPVPQRVKNIGVWYNIMNIIGKISVASNAIIIAFSSNFIPKLVYTIKLNRNHTESGFLEHSLAYFNVNDFPNTTAPLENFLNVTTCRYPEYRNPPWHSQKYKRPVEYWHVLAARLAFIVIYQNLVNVIITAIQYAIPDVSRKLRDRIKREAFKINETIVKHEMEYRLRTRNKKGGSVVRRKNGDLSGDTIFRDVSSENNGDIMFIDAGGALESGNDAVTEL
ncbi:anoctamin-1-like [Onthophagus taurus]|uniref:anoctamin-1-like n=1 Tax=Onthophagus taurus TaxID=166361 RepID=UPI0039BDD4DD